MAKRGSEELLQQQRERMAFARESKKWGGKKRFIDAKRLRFLAGYCRESGITKYTEKMADGTIIELVFGELPAFQDNDPEMGSPAEDRKRAEIWSS